MEEEGGEGEGEGGRGPALGGRASAAFARADPDGLVRPALRPRPRPFPRPGPGPGPGLAVDLRGLPSGGASQAQRASLRRRVPGGASLARPGG